MRDNKYENTKHYDGSNQIKTDQDSKQGSARSNFFRHRGGQKAEEQFYKEVKK